MSAITPILDTLLPQVHGRRGDVERVAAGAYRAPLAAVRSITPAHASDSRPQYAPQAVRSAGAKADTQSARGSTAGAGQAPAQAAKAEPAGSASARLHFSDTGRTIATLLQRFADASTAITATRLPLIAAGTSPAPATLAAVLAEHVGFSGVFYEAHLLQWFQGKRAQRQLYEEPQTRLPVAAGGRRAGEFAGTTTSTASQPTTLSDSSSVDRPPPAPGSSGHSHEHRDGVDQRLLPLLRQQLEVLNSAVYRWQGQAWPGVPMHWEIREDDPPARQPHAGMPPQRAYTTSLRLELPLLGPIEVRLALTGSDIEVHAWAGDNAAAATLRADKNTLAQRLRGTGFDRATVELITEPTS